MAVDIKDTYRTSAGLNNESSIPYKSGSERIVIGKIAVISDNIPTPPKQKIDPTDEIVKEQFAILEKAIEHAVSRHDEEANAITSITDNSEIRATLNGESFCIKDAAKIVKPYILNGGYQARSFNACEQNEKPEEKRADQKGYSALSAIHIGFTQLIDKFAQQDTIMAKNFCSHFRKARRYLLSYWDEYPLPSLGHLQSGDIPVIDKPTAGMIAYYFDEFKELKFEATFSLQGTETGHFQIVAEGVGVVIVQAPNGFTSEIAGDTLIITDPQGQKTILPNNTPVIFDGLNKKIIINPSEETMLSYRKILSEQKTQHEVLVQRSLNEGKKLAQTLDGVPVRVSGNIALPLEIDIVNKYNGNGIGLHRVEILLENRTQAVSEDEFYALFMEIAQNLESDVYDIRIADFEGDKETKMSLKEQETTIRNQMAAVLRVREYLANIGSTKRVDLMYPNIESSEHFIEKQKMLDEEAGRLGLSESFKLGSMVEIVALANDRQLSQTPAKFFSIGTNDLINNAIGIDRYDKSQEDRYDPTNPYVLELIMTTLNYANWDDPENFRAVSICGKMASIPKYVPLLLGMTARSLSVGSDIIPEIKEVIRRVDTREAKKLRESILNAPTRADREALLEHYCTTRIGLLHKGKWLDPNWQRPQEEYSPSTKEAPQGPGQDLSPA